MATPFDNRLIWMQWMGDKVGELDIPQLITTIKTFSPNATGVAIKTGDGSLWQGAFDTKRALAVGSVSAIQAWQAALSAQGLELYLWCVVRGRSPSAESGLIAQACSVPGVRSMVIDVDARDWFDGGLPASRARALAERIRSSVPAGFHLGLSFDPRGNYPARVFIDEWVRHVQSLHPRIFHWSYSEGVRGPQEYVDEAFEALTRYNLPVVPILQAFADPATLARVPQSHVQSAGERALSKGAAGLMVSYLGAAGPAEFRGVSALQMAPGVAPISTPPAGEAETFVVVTDLLNVRSAPGTEPRLIVEGERLSRGQRVQVFVSTRREADGLIFMQTSSGRWVAEKKADGSDIYLQPEGAAGPGGAGGQPETPKVIFTVVIDSLRVRRTPSAVGVEVVEAKLLRGQRVEVVPDSRTEADGFVWWQHSAGWSAEKKIGSTSSIFMLRLSQTEGGGTAETPWKFEKLPLSMADMRWFYYYGNTVFAFESGADHNYDGYSQGLHGGLDLGHPGGATVVAGVHGTFAGPGGSFGPNRVDVTIGEHRIVYGHLAAPANYPVGTPVTPDTYIGKIDNWAGHVHIEIRYQGRFILNPLLFLDSTLRDEIFVRFPAVGSAAFYSSPRWNKWVTPLDQPTILLGGPLIGPRAPV